MTKKSKLKKLLVLVIALLAISVSVLIVNAAQTQPDGNAPQTQSDTTSTQSQSGVQINTPSNTITTYFYEATGTFIVSGEGKIYGIYPRGYNDVDDGIGDYDPFPSEIIEVNTTVKHIIIEEGITGIDNCFNDLHNLETISLPDSIERIHDSFVDCDKIAKLIFPENLEAIDTCFYDCDGVTDIRFWGDAVNILNSFDLMDGLKEVHIPSDSVVGDCAFYGCKNLEKVVLGSDIYMYKDEWTYVPCFKDCNENMVIVADKKNEADYVREYNEDYYPGYYSKLSFAYYSTTPDNFKAKNHEDGVQLNWGAKYFVDTYHIYRKAKGESTWTEIGSTKASTYVDTTVKSNKTYTYMVKADDDSTGVTTTVHYIKAPDVSVGNTTTNTVKVKWDKIDGAVKYRVYRKDPYVNSEWEKLGDVTKTEYIDKTAVPNQKYYYTVKAFGENVTSSYEKEGAFIEVLSMPKVKSVRNLSYGVEITVNRAVGNNYYHNRIYKKAKGSNTWEYVGCLSWGAVYTDKKVKSGETYTYTVRSVSDYYENQRSAYDTKGKTITYLETPVISSATSTKTGVKLEWNKISAAEGYKIYRKTGDSGWGEAIATIKGNSVVTYVDKTAQKGVTYTYTIRAYKGTTKSGYEYLGKTVTDEY
ncbi:MAG: hypothetical protein E7530_10065 [Ruminococcaceae bacterium]|nr:hypothetical protein [Oscillospiraceae bacterium]